MTKTTSIPGQDLQLSEFIEAIRDELVIAREKAEENRRGVYMHIEEIKLDLEVYVERQKEGKLSIAKVIGLEGKKGQTDRNTAKLSMTIQVNDKPRAENQPGSDVAHGGKIRPRGNR